MPEVKQGKVEALTSAEIARYEAWLNGAGTKFYTFENVQKPDLAKLVAIARDHARLVVEANRIDSVLARRPALDHLLTPASKVEYAIVTAKRADDYERELVALRAQLDEANRELDYVRGHLLVLAHARIERADEILNRSIWQHPTGCECCVRGCDLVVEALAALTPQAHEEGA